MRLPKFVYESNLLELCLYAYFPSCSNQNIVKSIFNEEIPVLSILFVCFIQKTFSFALKISQSIEFFRNFGLITFPLLRFTGSSSFKWFLKVKGVLLNYSAVLAKAKTSWWELNNSLIFWILIKLWQGNFEFFPVANFSAANFQPIGLNLKNSFQ